MLSKLYILKKINIYLATKIKLSIYKTFLDLKRFSLLTFLLISVIIQKHIYYRKIYPNILDFFLLVCLLYILISIIKYLIVKAKREKKAYFLIAQQLRIYRSYNAFFYF